MGVKKDPSNTMMENTSTTMPSCDDDQAEKIGENLDPCDTMMEKSTSTAMPSCDDDQMEKIGENLGQFEIEIAWEGEGDLKSLKTKCLKNPGHTSFIPAPQFNMDHLPPTYQSQEMLEFVNTVSKLTAKLSVWYTSMNRPKGYPLHNYRGVQVLRTGTGIVTDVLPWKFHQNDGELCPCKNCVESANPSPIWGIVHVDTATHVLYDDLEVKKTIVRLFYDEEQDESHMCKLYGYRIIQVDIVKDMCKIECITHDIAACNMLLQIVPSLQEGYTTVLEKYKTNPNLLVFIVSHPHGCSKQISIGETIVREVKRTMGTTFHWSTYSYSTPTCRGSSGALVCILGAIGSESKEWYVHSDALPSGLNKSALGFEYSQE